MKKKFGALFWHRCFIALYFIALLVECYFLYSRHYVWRLYTRPLLMPLITLIYLLQVVSRNHLLLVVVVLTAWFGDFFTIQYNLTLQWVGLACYAASFLIYSIIFLRLQKFSFANSKLALFFALLGLAAYILVIQYIGKNRITVVDKSMMYGYACIIALLVTTGLNVFINNKDHDFRFLLPSLAIIVIAHLLFEASVFVVHRQYAFLDSITAFSYGVFQFIVMRRIILIEQQILEQQDLEEL